MAGHVEDELLKRNEYLAAENEILHSKLKGRLRLTPTSSGFGWLSWATSLAEKPSRALPRS